MRELKIAVAIAAACIGFAGCQEIQKVTDFLNGNNVTPQMVYVAANAFDAVESSATTYVKLPLCASGGPTVCRNAALTTQIVTAIRAGRAARSTLETAIKSSCAPAPDGTITCNVPLPTSPYNVIKAETATLQSLLSQ